MVLFQPSGPATVWEFGYYFGAGKVSEIIFWIAAILGFAFALFLLADYLNNRKPTHLYWGLGFALIWINTHVVIFSGTFATFLDPVPSVVGALTVGLFATGAIKSVKPDGALGKYYLYFVIIMSLAIGFFKTPYFSAIPAIVVPIVVMVLHIPSAFFIVWLPFTTRSENGKGALVLSLAGILMGLVGILLALTVVGGSFIPYFGSDAWLELIFNAFPYVYLVAVLCFAWGTFVPKQWAFAIPGIELE